MANAYRVELRARVREMEAKSLYVVADTMEKAIQKANTYMEDHNLGAMEMVGVDILRGIILIP